jgi:NTP pyrophosphatase (non-canonical NTP hydrolase)
MKSVICTAAERIEQAKPVIQAVAREHDAAVRRYRPFNSAHEGFAVLKEEVDELWDEIRKKDGARNRERMRREAVQIAAMAVRFITDVLGEEADTR